MFMLVARRRARAVGHLLTDNATLIGKTYESEDDLKYEAEAALAMGKAELNYNPAALPSTQLRRADEQDADPHGQRQPVPGLTVNLYAGQTGSTSGQFGRFASLVAKAHDQDGTGIRASPRADAAEFRESTPIGATPKPAI